MNKHNEVWGVHPLNDRLQRFAVVRVSDPGRGKSQVCTQVRSRKEADLISACHEMYGALEALLATYESDQISEFSYPGDPWTAEGRNDEVALAARAALNKAQVGAQ